MAEYRLVQNKKKHLCECEHTDCAYRKRERHAVANIRREASAFFNPLGPVLSKSVKY